MINEEQKISNHSTQKYVSLISYIVGNDHNCSLEICQPRATSTGGVRDDYIRSVGKFVSIHV